MIWWFDIHTLCRVITKIKINTNPPLHIVDIDSALFFAVRMLKIYSNQLSSIQYHVSCNHHTVPLLFRTSSSCKWKCVPLVLYHVGCHMTCRKESLHTRPGAWTGLGNWWQWRAMWVSVPPPSQNVQLWAEIFSPMKSPLQTETGTMNPKKNIYLNFSSGELPFKLF